MLDFEKTVWDIGRIQSGAIHRLTFLTPLTACATAILATQGTPDLRFEGGAESYAATIGLSNLLSKTASRHPGTSGATYSGLVELLRPETVDQCADSIRTLMMSWVTGRARRVRALARVLAEIMDNVPAHARGNGYAMAQTWPHAARVEIALADGGIGMPENVRRARVADIDTDAKAVCWCLEYGNSTVPHEDPWAQRGDWDGGGAVGDVPKQVRSDGGAHAGLGLATLRSAVAEFGGEAVVWSGSGCVLLRGDRTETASAPYWKGVAIAVRLPLTGDDDAPSAR